MKKFSIITIILIALLVSYYLFQPIISYNFGWKPLPKKQEAIINSSNNINNFFYKEYLKLSTPALSISIRKNDSIIYSNTLGYADIEKKIKATVNTKFRIGSVSKALTSGGLGVLIRNNKIKTSTRVKDYFPKEYENLSNITVKELASHTSGIRNYGTCFCFPIWEYYNNNQYDLVENAVKVFAKDNLLFKPSSAFSYSSYNYTMLSLLMEKSADMKFEKLMQEEVFKPLKMVNTSHKKTGKIATFYEIKKGEYKKVFAVNNSNKIAGGGFLSTPNDLTIYGNAVLSSKLFNKEIKHQLFTPVKLKDGNVNVQNYALGWRIDETSKIFNDTRKVKIIHHGGVAMGSTAFLMLLPEYNISAAIVMNRNINNGASELSNILYKIINELIHDDKVHSLKL